MKLGVSSYCFRQLMQDGEMDLIGVLDWVAKSPAGHIEVAAMDGEYYVQNPDVVSAAAKHSDEIGVPIVNYLVSGDLRTADGAEIDRLRRQLDVAHAFGARIFRHDVAPWAWREQDPGEFETTFAKVVEGCRAVADHAAGLGIVSTIENHGFYMNGGERLARLVHAVDRPNFRVTLDLGNGLCVGEVPGKTAATLIDVSASIGIKDFHIRRSAGDGWLKTLAGDYLLGTVAGHGDVDLPGLIKLISAKPDVPVSLEFEGLEATPYAIERSLNNIVALTEGAA
ncbi:sugar phosphate isomerase/epimerase family protein [Kribbella solani]|uniref:Sugar phosphate isomerase/epimerase n=1 Tax=Kribbella solani TaxID=236067 RepID=A0A841DIA0_9ACTN|nr:sugar phosphate isomerase/epimerase [Kribbella solani]MBB5978273.1 sugar phosphate isomerase/epimerase [Kribbella solani]MDX2971588.1 sugar phosphate isomerase/epimerase [Kribbella solani]MDX3005198.1 sugar phosphate isomerase/epimerase [Kribbella solani]